jgi:type IX secretion system PorP/SprF family membrane protein
MLLLLFVEAFAQDPQFTQFYAAPLYLNPGFAGTVPHSRLVMNARAQWAGLEHPFYTYAASFDHYIPKLNSGIGIIAFMDKAGTGGLAATSLAGIYSYKFNLNSKWVVRPAVQFAYASQSLDYYKLTFGDQLSLHTDSPISTTETFDKSMRTNFFDFSSGVVAHSEKFWIGLAGHHLNRPNQSLNQSESIIPIKTTLHGGMKIDLASSVYKKHGKPREQTITPAFHYKAQGKYDQLDVGLYYYFQPLVIGAWYRGIPVFKRYQPGYGNTDAVAVLVGFREEMFSVGYSYDLTISKLGPTNTAGSHEISLSFNFGGSDEYSKKHKVKKKDMVIPCPKF